MKPVIPVKVLFQNLDPLKTLKKLFVTLQNTCISQTYVKPVKVKQSWQEYDRYEPLSANPNQPAKIQKGLNYYTQKRPLRATKIIVFYFHTYMYKSLISLWIQYMGNIVARSIEYDVLQIYILKIFKYRQYTFIYITPLLSSGPGVTWLIFKRFCLVLSYIVTRLFLHKAFEILPEFWPSYTRILLHVN